MDRGRPLKNINLSIFFTTSKFVRVLYVYLLSLLLRAGGGEEIRHCQVVATLDATSIHKHAYMPVWTRVLIPAISTKNNI